MLSLISVRVPPASVVFAVPLLYYLVSVRLLLFRRLRLKLGSCLLVALIPPLIVYKPRRVRVPPFLNIY